MPTVLERFRAYTKSSNMDQKHLPKAASGPRKKNGSDQSKKQKSGGAGAPASLENRPMPVNMGTTLLIPRSSPLRIPPRWYTYPCGRMVSGYTTTGAGTTGKNYFLPRAGTDSKNYALPLGIPIIPGQGPSVTTKAPVGSNALYSLCSLYGKITPHRVLVHFVSKRNTIIDGSLSAAPFCGNPTTTALVEWKAGASVTTTDDLAVICAEGAVTRKIYESFTLDASIGIINPGVARPTHGSTTALTDSTSAITDANLNAYVIGWFMVGGDVDTALLNQETHHVFVSLLCEFSDWLGEMDADLQGFGLGNSAMKGLGGLHPSFPVSSSRDSAAVIPAALSVGDDKSGCSVGPPAATPIVTSKPAINVSTSEEKGYVVLGQMVQPEKSWFGRLAPGQVLK